MQSPGGPLIRKYLFPPWSGRVRDVTMGRLHVSWPRNVSFREENSSRFSKKIGRVKRD